MKRMLTAVLILASACSPGWAQPVPAAIDVIAFGSCAKEREPQPIWTEIVAQQPDLFLFIGDNMYADFQDENGKMVMKPVTDVRRIEEAYAALGAQDGFRRMQRTCPILATWDDHDFGANDAGKEYPLKDAAKTAFWNFWGEPPTSRRREQPGVYQSRTYGPIGQRVQVILLDTRYNRDALEFAPEGERKRRGPFVPTADTTRTILGEAQWQWLEKELREPAEVRLIASSIQVVADEHGFETWGNFPHERKRLYELIGKTGASGVIFLTGDRHLTEISVDRRPREDGAVPPYEMWDFTSSGMNERPQVVTDPNSYRVGPARRETTFGVVRVQWTKPVENTQIELVGYGDRGQIITQQTIFLDALRVKK